MWEYKRVLYFAIEKEERGTRRKEEEYRQVKKKSKQKERGGKRKEWVDPAIIGSTLAS